MKKAIILGAAFLLAGGPLGAGRPASAWLRGNTHTHTTASDGDTPVQQVVDWYHDHGYHFLLITDHNVTLRPGEVDMAGKRADFVLIPGNEISENSIHVTAANVTEPLTPGAIREAYERDGTGGEGVTDGARANPGTVTLFANHITAAGGMAFINHPNFADGVEVADILPARSITHLEVFNPDSVCYNWGNERFIPVEDKWDELLAAGRPIYAVAVDDAHHFREIRRQNCCPGRGWIMVDAGSADPGEILGAIAEGRFYASSGVLLDRCMLTGGRIAVKADEAATRAEVARGFLFPNITDEGCEGFVVEAIGRGGQVLKRTGGPAMSCKLRPGDGYIRIRVTYCEKRGDKYCSYYAWTQPVMENGHNDEP